MLPLTLTRPSLASMTPAMIFSMVLLPLPFWPIRATDSPRWMLKLTLSSAVKREKRSLRRTSLTMYSLSVFVRSCSMMKCMETLLASIMLLIIHSPARQM